MPVVFERFWASQQGNSGVMFSLVLVPLIAGAGVAIDYVGWRHHETRLQGVADSAALAGAMAYAFEGNKKKDQLQAETLATAAVNGYVDVHHAQLNAAPQITFTQAPQTVKVDFSQTGTRTFSTLLSGTDANITVSATAMISTVTTSPCVIGLNETASPAVVFSGSGPMIAQDCAVWSNSTQSVAMEGQGTGSATASMFCAAGGVLNGSISFSVSPQSSCPPVEDPLADLEMPTVGICSETNFQSADSGIVAINPGVYCGGIKLMSSGTLQLSPGEYILTDGPLEMHGGATLEGTGVTIIMTGTNSGLKLGGASKINMSAPASGTFAGVAFYSDRNSPVQSSSLRGSNSLDVEGTIYLPNHNLSYGGSNSATSPAKFTVLIAGTVEFVGSVEVSIRSDFDASAIPVPTEILQARIMPRLVK